MRCLNVAPKDCQCAPTPDNAALMTIIVRQMLAAIKAITPVKVAIVAQMDIIAALRRLEMVAARSHLFVKKLIVSILLLEPKPPC